MSEEYPKFRESMGSLIERGGKLRYQHAPGSDEPAVKSTPQSDTETAYAHHVNQQGTMLQYSAALHGTNSAGFRRDLNDALKSEGHFHAMAARQGVRLQYPGHLDYYASRKQLDDAGVPRR